MKKKKKYTHTHTLKPTESEKGKRMTCYLIKLMAF